MKRLLALLLSLLLAVPAGVAEGQAVSGESVLGRVMEIEGAELTFVSGTFPDMPEQPRSDGEAPAMPGGQVPEGGEAPAMPGGQAPEGGEAPAMPGGQPPMADGFVPDGEEMTVTITDATAISVEEDGGARDGTLADVAVGNIVRVIFGEDDTVASLTVLAGAPMGGFGGAADNGTAATTIAEDGTYSDGQYISEGNDENALRIDGATVELVGVTIDKRGGASSSTENGDFYGANAGLLALNGAQVTLEDAAISTAARNGNAVFSYGGGTRVTVRNSTVSTLNDNSGGLQTAGGGETYAENCTVTTAGASSAAIRSDRGGGTVTVEGGSYETGGTGSPAIYSTADIGVQRATLIASASEAVVVEGKNSVSLTDCAVTGNMAGTYGDSTENIHNVMLYQSTSGDADVGLTSFAMTGGSLTALAGDMFYITNTQAEITLNGVDMAYAEGGALLRAEGNDAARGWGTPGANGADVDFTAVSQVLEGDVVVDSISTLDFVLSGGSAFNGTINIVENAQGGAAVDGNANVAIGGGCPRALAGGCGIAPLDRHAGLSLAAQHCTGGRHGGFRFE